MSEAVDYVALLTAVPSVLVVGDESFEFSLGLAEAAAARGKSAGRWLCATAYEAAPVDAAAATRAAELGCLGAVVRQGVDATRLEGMHLCEPSIQVDWIPPPAFGAVVFNFPYVVVEGRRPRVDDNRELLVKFFASARRVLRPGGLVVVALARGQGGTPADATAGTRAGAPTRTRGASSTRPRGRTSSSRRPARRSSRGTTRPRATGAAARTGASPTPT